MASDVVSSVVEVVAQKVLLLSLPIGLIMLAVFNCTWTDIEIIVHKLHHRANTLSIDCSS